MGTIISKTQDRSAQLGRRARLLTPGGVHSNVRLTGPPVFFERGEGAWLFDVDGNDYLDYLLGQGPSFLGHAPAVVNDTVAREMRRGSLFGAQHVLENEAGELFLDTVRWADRVRFGVTGTESVQAAVRLARAATGRTGLVRFSGTYHGWLDNVLAATVDGTTTTASDGQLPHHLEDSSFVPFNDADELEATLDGKDDIAAVILEPMMCNSGVIPPRPGYLAEVREMCDRRGIVLIFDEVITGFRLAPGGAAERFGVTPDLAVYGKAMAGGWPVSALAGKAEIMDLLGDRVVHAGTFNSSVPACAAVIATLTALRDDPPYRRVHEHGEALMGRIRELGLRHGSDLRVQGLPAAFHVSFGSSEPIHDHRGLADLDLARYARLARTLVDHGLWVASRGIWYVSAAHGEHELAVASARLEAALAAERAV